MVLVATSLLQLIETGMVKSLGVLLIDIREQLSTHTWVIGLAISLSPGFGSIICGVILYIFLIEGRQIGCLYVSNTLEIQ